jgi:hypothetical protein
MVVNTMHAFHLSPYELMNKIRLHGSRSWWSYWDYEKQANLKLSLIRHNYPGSHFEKSTDQNTLFCPLSKMLSPRAHTENIWGSGGVVTHVLTLALDGGRWLVLFVGHLIPGKKTFGTHRIRGGVNLGVGLGI